MKLTRIVPIELTFVEVEFEAYIASERDRRETGAGDEFEILSIKMEGGRDELIDLLHGSSIFNEIERYLYEELDDIASDFEIENEDDY
jgi:hypothetical protein